MESGRLGLGDWGRGVGVGGVESGDWGWGGWSRRIGVGGGGVGI